MHDAAIQQFINLTTWKSLIFAEAFPSHIRLVQRNLVSKTQLTPLLYFLLPPPIQIITRAITIIIGVMLLSVPFIS